MLTVPIPLQESQAPLGELNEKLLGSGFWYDNPVASHIKFLLKYLKELSKISTNIMLPSPWYIAVLILSNNLF